LSRASHFRKEKSMNAFVKWGAAPLCAMTLAAAPALAQTARSSFVPYTTNGYVGLNVGKSEYKLPCSPGFNCEKPESFQIYTGGTINEWLGAEIGYLYMGKADRQGGTTRGHGINLSLVGMVPAGPVRVFGKVGTTYGRTTVSANSAANEPVGDEDGFGLSFGAGVQYDITSQWAVVGQWDRHHMKFAGRDRENVDALSVGVKFKF
jgi:OOP family OmpA-OmpF porin